VLEVMRQPLEDGSVTISRAVASLNYPARCMMITVMNPCPCGYYGDSVRACSSQPPLIQRYLQRISGPLLDRIDIHIKVPRLAQEELMGVPKGETSAQIRQRVVAGRKIQQVRYAGTGIFANAAMQSRHLRKHCALEGAAKELLKTAIEQLGLSARAYDRILKLERTIADLAESEGIEVGHVAEAIQHRTLDRKPCKSAPGDVDLLLIVAGDFEPMQAPAPARVLFDHGRAEAELGAHIFWLRNSLGRTLIEQFLEVYGTNRDGKARGVLEIDHG
jgi:magnesium chelatase family protein